ncbi:uncharacterized protein LOC112589410 [Harpegnathos saltator]|uniref:uncharacterized protein LOC112589410 n=1 Tax=Harpegnathos saltator TaxID=610380 RepID=UPI000DBEDCB4|nr:uncharacterized protein LOC112589410 [Harpegnathos saltator]
MSTDAHIEKVKELVLQNLRLTVQEIADECLREDVFPPEWRKATLVFPKKGKAPGDPFTYRPIYLLDEEGKMFQRIIAHHLVQHLSLEGPNLHDDQYGFRADRSTLDAIQRIRELARHAVEDDGVLLVVSLNILNAFNTLFWSEVGRVLEYYGVPVYLRQILSDYFRDRDLPFTSKGGVSSRRVASRKTQAVYFHDGSREAPPQSWVRVDAVRVRIGPQIEYLGLVLDGRWDFGTHFRRTALRVRKIELTLASLMRNQEGPSWHALRPVFIRAIRAYRTTSYMAATALAGLPSVELLARERHQVFWRVKKLRGEGETITVKEVAALRSQARDRALEQWQQMLHDSRVPGL